MELKIVVPNDSKAYKIFINIDFDNFVDKNHIQKTFLSGKTLYCDI